MQLTITASNLPDKIQKKTIMTGLNNARESITHLIRLTMERIEEGEVPMTADQLLEKTPLGHFVTGRPGEEIHDVLKIIKEVQWLTKNCLYYTLDQAVSPSIHVPLSSPKEAINSESLDQVEASSARLRKRPVKMPEEVNDL